MKSFLNDRYCNATKIYRTPIFYACLGGQAHTLKVMISELNCKASHTDKLGRTALHCAAFAGFTACIEVILGESVSKRIAIFAYFAISLKMTTMKHFQW